MQYNLPKVLTYTEQTHLSNKQYTKPKSQKDNPPMYIQKKIPTTTLTPPTPSYPSATPAQAAAKSQDSQPHQNTHQESHAAPPCYQAVGNNHGT